MKKPNYRIIFDDKDITSNFDNRLISMVITDNRGVDADTITIQLDDSDGALALPQRGINLSVTLGWSGENAILQNKFTIDECQHLGTPDRLSIRGKSANMRSSLNVKRDQSYDDTTVKAIIDEIAKRHDLDYRIDSKIESLPIYHIDQTNESDASFLTRLSEHFNAAATLKNGILIIFQKGAAQTLSGETIPTTTITRQSGDQHTFSIADREAYTGVKANWLDYNKANKQQMKITRNSQTKNNNVTVGADGNIKTLRNLYTNQQDAYQAATNEWEKLQRGAAKFTINLAEGRPDIYPEMPVAVSGFKKEIDFTLWTISKCTHKLDASNGYTTTVDLEIKLAEDEKPKEEN